MQFGLGKVIVLRRISDYGYITVPFSRLLRHAGEIYMTTQMCRRTEEVVPTVGLPTP